MVTNNMVEKQTTELRYVAFCGGGSGGHLSPAIAVAKHLLLSHQNMTISFVTSSRPIDAQVLNDADLPEEAVKVLAQPIASSAGKLRLLIATWKSILLCKRQFQVCRPNVVVGTGGFASVAGILAAWWLKIPIVLLECNAIPGRANRLLSRFSSATAAGWPITDKHLQKWKSEIHVTGIPVKAEFAKTDHNSDSQLMIVILGGSQGAERLNKIVLNALADTEFEQPLKIIHQTGQTHLSSVKQSYQDINVDSVTCAFIKDVASAISQADVVISRAGAVTLAEITTVGRPSILIPLSTAADDHQTANADFLCVAGAAIRIDETESNASEQLGRHLQDLLNHTDQRTNMSHASAQLSHFKATDHLVALLKACA